MRIGNALMASVGIAIGWLYCNNHLAITDLFLRMAAGFFALGFGNILNDICDINTDKISHPDRLLASGKIKLKTAMVFAIICFILSSLAGFSSSYKLGISTFIPLFILTLYSIRLKATPFAGNFVVALLTGYTLIFGGLGENVSKIFYPAILAILANFAREIIKDLSDEEGDKATGLKTTSSVDLKYIKIVIYLQFIAFVVTAALPYLFNLLGWTYVVITICFVIPIHFMYIRYFNEANYKKASDALKFQMIVGLIAVAADYFFRY